MPLAFSGSGAAAWRSASCRTLLRSLDSLLEDYYFKVLVNYDCIFYIMHTILQNICVHTGDLNKKPAVVISPRFIYEKGPYLINGGGTTRATIWPWTPRSTSSFYIMHRASSRCPIIGTLPDCKPYSIVAPHPAQSCTVRGIMIMPLSIHWIKDGVTKDDGDVCTHSKVYTSIRCS